MKKRLRRLARLLPGRAGDKKEEPEATGRATGGVRRLGVGGAKKRR